jgi:hypothetical protein
MCIVAAAGGSINRSVNTKGGSMTMSDHELDHLYTVLCKTMTQLGEKQAPLFLARFALLAIPAIKDAGLVRQLISDASEVPDDKQ